MKKILYLSDLRKYLYNPVIAHNLYHTVTEVSIAQSAISTFDLTRQKTREITL